MPELPQKAHSCEMVYVAGPLFSDAEKEFNRRIKSLLTRAFRVYLPQEDGHLLVEMIDTGVSPHVASKAIFQADVAAIRRSDCLLVILDGRCVDEGAAFELGMAYALGKRCYGLQTDVRRLLPCGNNPMIESALLRCFQSTSELDTWISELAMHRGETPLTA